MQTTIRTLPLLLAVMACTSEGSVGTNSPTPTDPSAPDDPSPYIVDEQEAPEPSSSIADVTDALQSALNMALDVNAQPVRTAYDEVMTHSNGACPYYYETENGAYWLDNCMAPSGAQYNGYVFSLDQPDVFNPDNGFTTSTWYAFGGATVIDPTGQILEMGGAAVLQTLVGQVGGKQNPLDLFQYTSQLQGSFGWDGPSATGTFLDGNLDPDFSVQLQEVPNLGRSALVVGGFGGYNGGWAVAFDQNVIYSAVFGSSCETEMSGTIAVRSPAGEWYDIRFDGPENDEDVVAPADCDGCGVAYFQGVEVGQICADFSPLMTWEGTPW